MLKVFHIMRLRSLAVLAALTAVFSASSCKKEATLDGTVWIGADEGKDMEMTFDHTYFQIEVFAPGYRVYSEGSMKGQYTLNDPYVDCKVMMATGDYDKTTLYRDEFQCELRGQFLIVRFYGHDPIKLTQKTDGNVIVHSEEE